MEYPKLVIDEAKALRKHATEAEISNLDFNSLKPDTVKECIYGQMTGHCFSERAKELIEKSCKRVYSTTGSLDSVRLNGSPVGKHRENEGKAYMFRRNTDYWSPIEVFLPKSTDEERLKLVQFIKGEIESL